MKEFLSEFLHTFMNNMTIMNFLVFLTWAYIGMFISLGLDLSKRKPASKSSPKKLSGKYYISDNTKRLLLSFILIPISILVFGELFGMEINNDRAMFIGLCADELVLIYKKRKEQFSGKILKE